MKILQISYKADISGGEMVLLNVTTYLKRQGHEVHAVCPKPGGLSVELEKIGVTRHYIPIAKTYDLKAMRALRQLVKTERFDLVHSHGMLVNIVSRMACRSLPHTKHISTVHLTRDLRGKLRYPLVRQRLKNIYYRLYDNWTSQFSHRVIAVSHAVKEDLIRQGQPASRVTVIQNGISVVPSPSLDICRKLKADLGLGDDEIVIGAVVRMSPQKDIPTLLQAFKIIHDHQPQTRLLLIGDGMLDAEMKALALEMKLNNAVIFAGFRSDVRDLYFIMDIFVLTSLWEGLPLVVLEAMASGVPVVATAVDGTKEAVVDGETGYLLPVKSPQAFAEAVLRLTNNADARRHFGEMAAQRIRDYFSIERMCRETETLYQHTVTA